MAESRSGRSLRTTFQTLLIALFAGSTLISCQSLKRLVAGKGLEKIPSFSEPRVSSDPCVNADWFEVGRVDGLSGIPGENSVYLNRCKKSGAEIGLELYTAGWQRGLIDYCTPERGLDAGRTGKSYNGVCPYHVEPAFLKRFEIGAKISALEKRNLALESMVDSKLRELEYVSRQTQPSILDDALARGPAEVTPAIKEMSAKLKRQKELQDELTSLRLTRERNELAIRELEQSVSL